MLIYKLCICTTPLIQYAYFKTYTETQTIKENKDKTNQKVFPSYTPVDCPTHIPHWKPPIQANILSDKLHSWEKRPFPIFPHYLPNMLRPVQSPCSYMK